MIQNIYKYKRIINYDVCVHALPESLITLGVQPPKENGDWHLILPYVIRQSQKDVSLIHKIYALFYASLWWFICLEVTGISPAVMIIILYTTHSMAVNMHNNFNNYC